MVTYGRRPRTSRNEARTAAVKLVGSGWVVTASLPAMLAGAHRASLRDHDMIHMGEQLNQ